MMALRRFKPVDVAVSAVFVALLLAPAVLALIGRAGVDTTFILNTELRKPFVAPPVTSGAFADGGWQRDAERQIGDAFPLRTPAILGYDYVKYMWLGDVASPLVIRGRDGWLFFGAAEERSFIAGGPSDGTLTRVAGIYAARSAWCAQRGMRYVFLLAPDKSTVYARDLPAGIVPRVPSGSDRLFAMLRARGVTAVDPRRALIDASHDREVYSKGDTHWNYFGAYLAYRATMDALRLPGITPGALRFDTSVDAPGDLQRMAGVAEWIPNLLPGLHVLGARVRAIDPPAAASAAALGPADVSTTAVDDASLPTLVAFGDSFIEPLRPFLEKSFRHAVIVHHLDFTAQFDEALLASERPAVVLQVLSERNLAFGDTFIAP